MRAYQFITEYSRAATIGNPGVARKLIDRFKENDLGASQNYRIAIIMDNAVLQKLDSDLLLNPEEALRKYADVNQYLRLARVSQEAMLAYSSGKSTKLSFDIDEQKFANLIADEIEKVEPKVNERYLPWIFREYINGNIQRIEDTSAARANLLLYDANKRRRGFPQEAKDIMRITADQLRAAVAKYNPDDPESIAQNMGDYDVVYGSLDVQQNEVGTPIPTITSDVVVIRPKDKAASLYFGRVLGGMTEWCTAYIPPQTNRFDLYNKAGPLYIIIPKNPYRSGEKYQLHFETGQFMDEFDKPIDITWLLEDRYPQIKDTIYSVADLKNIIQFCDDSTVFGVHNTAARFVEFVIEDIHSSDNEKDSTNIFKVIENISTYTSEQIKRNSRSFQQVMDQMPLVDSMHDLIVFELEEQLYELPLAIIDSINRRILITDNKHLEGHTATIRKYGARIIAQKTIDDFTVILKSEY
jgi:hypothetical protein